jgi:hypothetical protein
MSSIKFIILSLVFLFGTKSHPYYLSVTNIKYNDKNKSLEVAIKMFTSDLENALKRTTKKSIDIINPKDKKEVEKILIDYVNKRLHIKLNGKDQTLKLIGYEKEDDSVWTYLEIEKCEKPKTFVITNSLLYDFLKEQINIVEIEVAGKKQSSRLVNPEKEIKFTVPN